MDILREVLCNFDWMVFWTSVQAVAVSVGLIIAYYQLKSYRAAERTKTTTEVLDKFSVLEDAYRTIVEPDPTRARESNRLRMEAHYNGTIETKWRDAVIDISNFFERAGALYDSQAIDRQFYLSEFAAATQASYTALADALVVFYRHEGHGYMRFYKLAKESGAYIRRNGPKVKKAMDKLMERSSGS